MGGVLFGLVYGLCSSLPTVIVNVCYICASQHVPNSFNMFKRYKQDKILLLNSFLVPVCGEETCLAV